MRLHLETLEDRITPAYWFSAAPPEAFTFGFPRLPVGPDRAVYYTMAVGALHGITPAEVAKAAVDAWADWAAVVPLNIQEVPPGSALAPRVDVSSSFIDGPLGILAFTSQSPNGRSVVIDATEPFTADEAYSTALAPPITLRKVFGHEFGHALGLGHEEAAAAIMQPTYRGSPARVAADDAAGVQALYGAGVGTVNALPPPPPRKRLEAVGGFDPGSGQWFLSAVAPFVYGAPGWLPVMGDWDGDGTDTVGVVDPGTGAWYLRNSNDAGPPTYPPFQYGLPGWLPVSGDWSGAGRASVGTVDPVTETWYLAGLAPFRFGAPGWKPLAGDWDGTGWAKPGAYNPLTGIVYEAVVGGVRAVQGDAGAVPVAGAWDNGTAALIGFLVGNRWRLLFPSGPVEFVYGLPGWLPVAGRWA